MKKIYVFIIHIVCSGVAALMGMGNTNAQSIWMEQYEVENAKLSNEGWWEHTNTTKFTPLQEGGYALMGLIQEDENAPSYPFLIKTDGEGQEIWRRTYPAFALTDNISELIYHLESITQTTDGGYLMLLRKNISEHRLFKLDAQGQHIWTQELTWEWETPVFPFYAKLLLYATSDGGHIILRAESEDFAARMSGKREITKYAADGTLSWARDLSDTPYGNASRIRLTDDNGLLLTGWDDENYRSHFGKMDSQGQWSWQDSVQYEDITYNTILDIIPASDGGYFRIHLKYQDTKNLRIVKTNAEHLVTSTHDLPQEYSNYWSPYSAPMVTEAMELTDGSIAMYQSVLGHDGGIIKLAPDGTWTLLDMKSRGFVSSDEMEVTPDDGFVFFGNFHAQDVPTLIKADSQGKYLPKTIRGYAALDYDGDCVMDSNSQGLSDILVKAVNLNGQVFSTFTDSTGYYEINVPADTLSILVDWENPYASHCEDTPIVEWDTSIGSADTANVNIILQSQTACPLIHANLYIGNLRECVEDNLIHISVKNEGTASAENAYLELTLDENLIISSSPVPYSGPSATHTYSFPLGDMPVGDSRQFTLQAELVCPSGFSGELIGQTLCAYIRAYPDNLCGDPTPPWDGSDIEVEVECEQDSVVFRIQNIGVGDMDELRAFYVIEDEIMVAQDEFQLDAGEALVRKRYANGSTFRIVAQQDGDHPFTGMPTVAIEGCGGALQSSGFINQFPEDYSNPTRMTVCTEITSSYDPNDKQALPKGHGDAHSIGKNTDIRYTIRFQNTGNDTAFTVVVRDTLSEYLDLTTIQPLSSSHAYRMDIIGRTLKFTFNDIMLLDSLTNEPESHGFIQLKVAQMPNLPLGTLIENTAGIYFDYNLPVITNTVTHTIAEDFIEENIVHVLEGTGGATSDIRVKAYPNPFGKTLNIDCKGLSGGLEMRLFDTMGRKVFEKKYDRPHIRFHRGHLQGGVYLYTLHKNGRTFAEGRIVIAP